jgi:hypothetical protein
MLAHVAFALKTSLQLPVPVSSHAAVGVPTVRVHVATGALPVPTHAAAHVAPTLLLKQPAVHIALLMGWVAAVGTPGHVTAVQSKILCFRLFDLVQTLVECHAIQVGCKESTHEGYRQLPGQSTHLENIDQTPHSIIRFGSHRTRQMQGCQKYLLHTWHCTGSGLCSLVKWHCTGSGLCSLVKWHCTGPGLCSWHCTGPGLCSSVKWHLGLCLGWLGSRCV